MLVVQLVVVVAVGAGDTCLVGGIGHAGNGWFYWRRTLAVDVITAHFFELGPSGAGGASGGGRAGGGGRCWRCWLGWWY